MSSEYAVSKLSLPFDSGYDTIMRISLPKGTTIMQPRKVWSLFGKRGGGTEVRSYDEILSSQYTTHKMSELVPNTRPNLVKQESGGTLIYHENFGGHPVSKHVGRTDTQLIDRFVTEPHIPSSSSFTNMEIADQAVGQVLSTNRSKIRTWLSDSDRQLPLSGSLDFEVGRKVLYGSTSVQTSTDAFVLLRRDPLMPSGYRVHTAYPD
jgi:hypothetical protein